MVFINGCGSTENTDGVAGGYKDAFNTQDYVGWDLPVNLYESAKASETFFKALGDKDPATGEYKISTVAAATGSTGGTVIKATEATDPSFGTGVTLGPTPLKVFSDSGIILNNNSQ